MGKIDQLRFLTAGSVDDGKSTLIGRLLYDAGVVRRDQMAALERNRSRNENGTVNLALLTDGLMDEREQGITIDVAWKYFTTARRRFVVIDAPGHVQYTRNMVTGATHADVALILVDARKGVLEQTRRHFSIAALLGLPGIAVCVNKMDLVGWDRSVFERIRDELSAFAEKMGRTDLRFLPVSALGGENVTSRGSGSPWYEGPTVLEWLESFPAGGGRLEKSSRFVVQTVLRPQSKEWHDYRGIAGQIVSGSFSEGQAVKVWPAGLPAVLSGVDLGGARLGAATAPSSVALRFDREIDVGRGDLVAEAGDDPIVSDEILIDLCWMDDKPLLEGRRLLVRQGTGFHRASVRDLSERLDLDAGARVPLHGDGVQLRTNEIGRGVIKLARPVAFDPYAKNRLTGGLVLIDEATNRTVGAGLAMGAAPTQEEISI